MHEWAEDLRVTLDLQIREVMKKGATVAEVSLVLQMALQTLVLEEMTRREERENWNPN